MAENKKVQTIAEALAARKIPFGSKGHIALIEASYNMTVEKARAIVKERPENPNLYPYDLYEKALAMLEQLKTIPEPVSTKPGWRRDRG